MYIYIYIYLSKLLPWCDSIQTNTIIIIYIYIYIDGKWLLKAQLISPPQDQYQREQGYWPNYPYRLLSGISFIIFITIILFFIYAFLAGLCF
jgi:hypothetical protein